VFLSHCITVPLCVYFVLDPLKHSYENDSSLSDEKITLTTNRSREKIAAEGKKAQSV
jgi:hypothetical protein